MTPKEFEFVLFLVETASEHAYALGHADGMANKPLQKQGFRPSKESQLHIKNSLNNLLKKH